MNWNEKNEWYSIVVYPQKEAIRRVKTMKDSLADHVGWYPSRNAEAHISILEFYGAKKELTFYLNYVKNFCYAQHAEHVIFDNVVKPRNGGAIVLLPERSSKIYFSKLFKSFKQGLKNKNAISSSNAHISIGRKLSIQQVATIDSVLDDVNLAFICNKIAIRKFNDGRSQYEVIYEFDFLGNTANGELLLFQ